MKEKKLWVVCYSTINKDFRICPLLDLIQNNRRQVEQGRNDTYQVIGFGQTKEAALAIRNILKRDLKLEEIEII